MSSEKLKYISYGQTVDGTNYCAGVETLAENLIEDNEKDAVIVFPSPDTWAGLRSSAYRMTDQNTEIQVPSGIYKLNKLLLFLGDEFSFSFTISDQSSFAEIKDLKYKDGSTVTYLDISKFVVEKTIWDGFPVAKSTKKGSYIGGYYKDNTLIWQQGSDTISMDATVRKIKDGVLDLLFPDDSRVYHRVVLSALYEEVKAGNIIAPSGEYFLNSIENVTEIDGDVRKWKFRIEYVPISSKTKLRARKSAKTNFDYIQPHNQRAEVNAVSAFGKNMWLEAQKTGVQTITVVKRYTKLADIPPVGALVMHNGKRYRLTANSYKQTNTIFLQVTHTLSENWTSKSKHVSVDQKYRNYSIPQEAVSRNLYWEDFITVSGDRLSGDTTAGIKASSAMQMFSVSNAQDKTVDTFAWLFEGDEVNRKELGDGIVIPCATYGIANSMVFSASFKDQLSAGLTMDVTETKDKLCKEALYCNTDGTLQHATVMLSDGIESIELSGNFSAEKLADYAQNVYPVVLNGITAYDGTDDLRIVNYPKDVLFGKLFYIDKDPGEALKFTYQVHFVTDGDCVVGNKLAEHNTLIKRYDGSRVLKVWLLPNYIRVGADKLDTANGIDYTQDRFTPFVFFTVETDDNAGTAKIDLSALVKQELTNYKAWAITDENNNLYVGRNENSAGVVHFTLSHKRI